MKYSTFLLSGYNILFDFQLTSKDVPIFPAKELVKPKEVTKSKPVGLRSWTEAKKHFENQQK